MANSTFSYELTLHERGNVQEKLYGPDIGLQYETRVTGSLKLKQNKTLWFWSWSDPSALRFEPVYTYDDKLLKEQFHRLSCIDPLKVTEPKDAAIVYSNGAYRIIKEVYGNKINQTRLYSVIEHSITSGNTDLDLNRLNCYYIPNVRSDSTKVINTEKAANLYLNSAVIYAYDGGRTVVDKDEISQWIEFNSDLLIKFNEKKIKVFLYALADHYNTYGKFRNFTTSTGEDILIGGGDYGWLVDIDGEMHYIIDAVVQGKTTYREPGYKQKGAVQEQNDIGLTYVEINLTKQHLWYYKDGSLVVQGDIVSGDINDGYKTPEGIYSLKYKIKNAMLSGENYQTKVTYWMPFNNDIGIHDANWRSAFGGNYYLTRGSHGCINAPFRLAEALFKNVSVGIPVICYY